MHECVELSCRCSCSCIRVTAAVGSWVFCSSTGAHATPTKFTPAFASSSRARQGKPPFKLLHHAGMSRVYGLGFGGWGLGMAGMCLCGSPPSAVLALHQKPKLHQTGL